MVNRMPRKPKAKNPSKSGSGKNSSYRPTNFSMKNTSLLRFGYSTMLADGKLSRENIIAVGSKTLFGQLKNDGYIKESSEKGVFKTTDKFKSEFSKLIGDSRNFGGSTSGEQHQKLVGDIVTKIPESSLLRGDFKNGNQLAAENRPNKKTPEFKGKVMELKQEISSAWKQNEQDYKAAMSDSSLSDVERTKAEIDYFYKKDELEMQEKVLDDKRGISAPDFQFMLTKAEANEFVENLRELGASEEYSKYQEQWEEQVTRMESYISSCETEIIEICTEIIDSNYSRNQIQSKEFYSRVYEKPVFYFHT